MQVHPFRFPLPNYSFTIFWQSPYRITQKQLGRGTKRHHMPSTPLSIRSQNFWPSTLPFTGPTTPIDLMWKVRRPPHGFNFITACYSNCFEASTRMQCRVWENIQHHQMEWHRAPPTPPPSKSYYLQKPPNWFWPQMILPSNFNSQVYKGITLITWTSTHTQNLLTTEKKFHNTGWMIKTHSSHGVLV